MCLQQFACWDGGFEFRWSHESLSLVTVVCYQVEFFEWCWSLVHRIPTESGLCDCDKEPSAWRKPRPLGAVDREKIMQNIYSTYIHHSQIWYRDKLPRCQLEPLVNCSNDEHQTSLKWDRSSHPVAPECHVSHTVHLKHFTINAVAPFESSCLAYWNL
jgi:hypothetical protein